MPHFDCFVFVALSGDLMALLEQLGIAPPCPSSAVRFTVVNSSTPWMWNVSFQETRAGSYYMDIFFQEPGKLLLLASDRAVS